ncbi:DUF421 domain-containing protein [Paenibacillus woosongensis]|uniref:DUF421 domain-containing protein n=1 Tax=Paenibacillus woosongensis TaxID=307580 RepID=A0A7X2Z3Y0_9BACL|nr:DUF421 domain-containing protein [Paenibacillus woosongensis]MUG46376.1 DUF421 domain-containing protein [Paenibacillus woosongensis]
MVIGKIALKIFIGFVGLWVLTRLLGKKEISQLTPFDFVSSVMLSDLVGETVYDEDIKYSELIFALFLWGLLSFVFEKISQKLKRARGFLDGKPSIIIRDGKVDLRHMRQNGLDFDQLRMLLRQHEVFFISEVAYAIFEPNGTLSVMKRPQEEAIKRKDLGLDTFNEKARLSYCLVENGVIDRTSLQMIGKDEAWLQRLLEKSGYERVEDVAYAEWKEDENLYVVPQQRNRREN